MDAKERSGALLMLLCALMWSTGGMFIKLLPWNPLVIAGVRSAVASAVIGVYMIISRQRVLIDGHSIRVALALALCMTSFVLANKLTSAANAVVLQYTAPIYVLLYGWVFKKQRVRVIDCAAVACAIGGIALLFAGGLGGGGVWGNSVALFSGVVFSAVHVNSNLAPKQSRMSGLLLGHALTALIGLPFVAAGPTPVTGVYAGLALLLGVVQVGIPYIFFGWAAGRCSALTSILMGALEPLLSPLWVFLFAGEWPDKWAFAGCVIVVAAVTGWCVCNARGKESA